jgi:16S rRNA (guanine1516-N2)-methyltransferase
MIKSQLHPAAIFCDTPAPLPALQKVAQQLSQQLELPVIDDAQHDHKYEYLLLLKPIDADPGHMLSLQQCGNKAPGPVFAEFVSGKTGHRRRFGGGKGQILARAVGIKGPYRPTIIDATAGLGKDAFVLACLGCKITLLERSPIIAALLHNGMQRALADSEVGDIIQKYMQLQALDAREFLATTITPPHADVIYLDPMFPDRTKSALVKKEMRLFKAIIGDDDDAGELLALALTRANRRVVVKRPRLAPPLQGPAATLSLQGKSIRYDIYIVPRKSEN